MVYPGLMSPKLNKSEEKAPKVSFMLAPNLQSPYSVVGCANAAAVDASTLFKTFRVLIVILIWYMMLFLVSESDHSRTYQLYRR